jgi:UDP-N-acetylglucosamine--N-acetylmuramyl-(pentapeptide) pyrophosphoryl-undecaprenol N-acetylglucosamine transferase
MAGAASKIRCPGKVVVNGNPIASKFLNPPPQHRARQEFGLKPEMTTLLITGGSQGAQAINEAVLHALPELLNLDPPIQILHQVGEKNFVHFSSSLEALGAQDNRYVVRPYINDLAVAYSACDLTLCRAGAMTIAELGVSGTPAIFVPYPFAAQNHQTHNARFVEQQGAALVLMQSELNAQSLTELVRRLLSDKQRLNNMRQAMRSLGRPQAAHDVAQQIKQLSTEYQRKSGN